MRFTGIHAAPQRAPRARGDADQTRLTRPRARRALACALERLVEQPEWPLGRSRGVSSVIPVDLHEVRHARPTLVSAARLLRSDEPVAARGMLAVRDLLRDGNGPLYLPQEPGEFASRLRSAVAILAGARS